MEKRGRSKTPTYRSWIKMRNRCSNPNNDSYADYGGRGIKVCDRWQNFFNFLEDMGERPENTSIDRIDVNGNYEPGNCRWANSKTQSENKRTSIYFEVDGQIVPSKEAASKLKIKYVTLTGRLRRGEAKDILFRPAAAGRNKKVIEVDGMKMTLDEAAAKFGKTKQMLISRLHIGFSEEDACKRPMGRRDRFKIQKNTALIILDGIQMTARQASEIYGIKTHTIMDRLRAGWSVDDACKKPISPNSRWAKKS